MATMTSYGPSSERLGGLARAKTARGRDAMGRFLPDNPDAPIKPYTYHGTRGGIVRAQQAKRDSKGRFTK